MTDEVKKALIMSGIQATICCWILAMLLLIAEWLVPGSTALP